MPGVEQLLDVLPALLVARAGHVGVRELVDQGHLRAAGQHGVDVHLGEGGAAVGELAARARPPGPSSMLGGVPAAVGLDEPDHDVGAALGAAVALAEHRVGLADPGCCTEVDPQLAARHDRTLPALRRAQASAAAAASRARLSSSTLTRGSPRKPSVRPWVCSATSARTAARAQPALPRHPGDLLRGVRGADVRVEAGAAGQQRVRGDLRPARRRPAWPRSRGAPRSAATRSLFSGPRLEAEVDERVVPGAGGRGPALEVRRVGFDTALPSASFFGLPFS